MMVMVLYQGKTPGGFVDRAFKSYANRNCLGIRHRSAQDNAYK